MSIRDSNRNSHRNYPFYSIAACLRRCFCLRSLTSITPRPQFVKGLAYRAQSYMLVAALKLALMRDMSLSAA